jgi:hypothetical protein
MHGMLSIHWLECVMHVLPHFEICYFCCCCCCHLLLRQIVYVAPMKALAAEVTANFGKRLAALGLVVKELTGKGPPLCGHMLDPFTMSLVDACFIVLIMI